MKINIEHCEYKEFYILGTKRHDETTFFIRVVEWTPQQRQKSWQKFEDNNMDFYFLPLSLPYKLKDAPF